MVGELLVGWLVGLVLGEREVCTSAEDVSPIGRERVMKVNEMNQ